MKFKVFKFFVGDGWEFKLEDGNVIFRKIDIKVMVLRKK